MQEENDILYIQISDRRIVAHTSNEPHIGSLSQQLELILGCFGFFRADQNKFVQESKILFRDKKEKNCISMLKELNMFMLLGRITKTSLGNLYETFTKFDKCRKHDRICNKFCSIYDSLFILNVVYYLHE